MIITGGTIKDYLNAGYQNIGLVNDEIVLAKIGYLDDKRVVFYNTFKDKKAQSTNLIPIILDYGIAIALFSWFE